MKIFGNDNGLFNIDEYTHNAPTAISTYNSGLCAVQRASNSGSSLLTYRPSDIIPQFTQFSPNSGYIVLAKNNFTVLTPPPLSWDIEIIIPTPGDSLSINIGGSNPNIWVNWGNGTSQTYTTIGKKTRSYAIAGNYTIKLSGSFGSDGSISLPFNGLDNSYVVSVSTIPPIPGLVSLANCFSTHSFLSSIPSNLFNYNLNITNLNSCFDFCEVQSTLPLGSFDNLFNLTIARECFKLNPVSAIPAGLFDNNRRLHDITSCFEQCFNLQLIPDNLFKNNTELRIARNVFQAVPIKSIPSTLFTYTTAVTAFGNTFLNCTALTSVPSNLFTTNLLVSSFVNCFGGVTLPTESYSNLLVDLASNANLRPNNVPFGGGNSKYNTAGQTARDTLTAKGWTFTDGGLEP